MINPELIQKPDEVASPLEGEIKPLKLELACGNSKEEGWTGIDIVQTEQADVVHDLRVTPWPFASDSVDEARCSHFFEHLGPQERITFMNELHRVLKPERGCTFVTPLGFDRMVQDFSHKWPPVVAASYFYFDQTWLQSQRIGHYAVLHGILCNFEVRPLTGTLSQEFSLKADEHKMFALRHYMNAPVDLVVVMVKRP